MWVQLITKWSKDKIKEENVKDLLLANPRATDVDLWNAIKKLERDQVAELAISNWTQLNGDAKEALTTILRQKGVFLDLKRKIQEGRGKELKGAIELAKILEYAEAVPLLAEKLNHFDIEVSLAAMEGLKSFPPHISLPKLLTCLSQPEKYIPARISDVFLAHGEKAIGYLTSVTIPNSVQSYTIDILGQLGQASYPVLKDFLSHPNGQLREKSLEALLGGETLSLDLMDLVSLRLKDENRKVKGKAIEVWAKFKGSDEPEPLLALVTDEDWLIRNKALASLENHFSIDKAVWEAIKEPYLRPGHIELIEEWSKREIISRR